MVNLGIKKAMFKMSQLGLRYPVLKRTKKNINNRSGDNNINSNEGEKTKEMVLGLPPNRGQIKLKTFGDTVRTGADPMEPVGDIDYIKFDLINRGQWELQKLQERLQELLQLLPLPPSLPPWWQQQLQEERQLLQQEWQLWQQLRQLFQLLPQLQQQLPPQLQQLLPPLEPLLQLLLLQSIQPLQLQQPLQMLQQLQLQLQYQKELQAKAKANGDGGGGGDGGDSGGSGNGNSDDGNSDNDGGDKTEGGCGEKMGTKIEPKGQYYNRNRFSYHGGDENGYPVGQLHRCYYEKPNVCSIKPYQVSV